MPAHSLPFPISLLLAPRVCIRTYLPGAHVCTMYESMYLVRACGIYPSKGGKQGGRNKQTNREKGEKQGEKSLFPKKGV